jgi:hypothetical protein
MRFGIGGRKGMPMMSDKSLLDGGMLPGVCRILERKPLTWHDMAWVGSTRMPGSVRCRQTHHHKRHPVFKRTGLLRTAVVGPSSGLAYAGMHCSIPILPKACERPLSACSMQCRQPAASCNNITGWTRAALAGADGLRPSTCVYALPLPIHRGLHCIARASVQQGGKKHVSNPTRWCGATQRTWKKAVTAVGLRTALRTFVRI